MTLNILKSEDIIFKDSTGEKIVNSKAVDLNKVATIEGVSEFSVLQLEYKGETYLLTEEFSVEATAESLDEFLEEYDEEDEDTDESTFDVEEELLILNDDEEVLEEELEEKFKSERARSEKKRQYIEEEENKAQIKQADEEQGISFNTSLFVYQSGNESGTVDSGEVLSSSSIESISTLAEESVLSENIDLEESAESVDELTVESTVIVTPPPLVQFQTVIENRIEETGNVQTTLEPLTLPESEDDVTLDTELNEEENTNNDVQTLEEDPLIEEDLATLETTDNVVEDTTVNEVQEIADVLIKLENGSDLSQEEFTLLGLNNLSSEDVADLNMALNDSDSISLGTTPTINLQIILDSLNVLDSGTDVSLTDLSNIGVTGVGGTDEPTLVTLNAELNGEENTDDVQALVDSIQAEDDATSRLSTESLTLGDLAILGINGLDENTDNIVRINNILLDSDVDIGSDVTQLQAIVDVLIKIDLKDGDTTGIDITGTEWQLIGLNNVSSPDANELNIALGNNNSLALGTTPLTNLQLIVDSLNALDQVKYGTSTGVTLADLTNIGVTGIGGVGEPTLKDVNTVLYDDDVSADHTNSVQAIVDTLVKVLAKDGDSEAIDLSEAEWEILGINNLSSPDANELNIALGNSNSLALGTSTLANLQLIVDSLNAFDEVKYGHTIGVSLIDLTNIGVTGVGGGGDEPTLEAVNTVLFDDDVSADHTNSVQAVVDALTVLNTADGDWRTELNESDLTTLGITAPDNNFSSDELEYINYRIDENSPATNGDGSYVNDTVELQLLVDGIDGHIINIGELTSNTYTYVENELYDALSGAGDDTLNVLGGTIVDLSAIHDFEEIVLNSDASINDTTLGSALDEINIADVLDITDGSSILTISRNEGTGSETVHLDTSEFSTDEVLYGDYYVYTANGGTLSIRIEEHILVE